ncbi:MAG TPA: putative oxidoreductase C-terminal domain-containing protein [Longimicrobiaceae bacterium]
MSALPRLLVPIAVALMTSAAAAQDPAVRFMSLDPGHFHAALIHKEMYPGVSPRLDVYAPLGFDLTEHLARISAFNDRPEAPTRWRAEVHTGPDFFERMLAERPGNVVVIAGRNSKKIDYILGSVNAGLHVLADKPWIVRSADLPRLEQALEMAERRGVAAYDVMTERYEVTNAVQRELVNDPAVFGETVPGTPEEPAVYMKSVHHILKTVAGAPLRRPLWWFEPAEQGEALSDVGTHLVDLALWTLFPEQALDHGRDVTLHSARAWRTRLSREQFSRLTGSSDFPPRLAAWVEGDSLGCECNTQVVFALRGVTVKLDVLWDDESTHADTHDAVYRGSKARVEVRQGEREGWRPEVYVVPNDGAAREEVLRAVRARIDALQSRWPGITAEESGGEVRLTIPDRHRLGHENHFGEVASRFLEYVASPASLPAWEKPNMLVKYFVTTRGTELSHAPR